MSGASEQAIPSVQRTIPEGAVWTRLAGFGLACAGEGWRVYVEGEDDVRRLFDSVRGTSLRIAFRGSGASYGDASINTGELVCDCTRMNQILDWNPETGVIHVEGGVTIEQIWRHVIEDGYWPPVVSGTMVPTVAGALAMNIHGKNCFAKGPIGDHVLDFRLATPDGRVMDCSPSENKELFEAVISSFGSLGYIVSARLKLTKLHSGRVDVRAFNTRDLDSMFQCFAEHIDKSDYLVGWIDGFTRGARLGRGIVHSARYLGEGEDDVSKRSFHPKDHELPTRILGVIPKKWMWRFVKPFANRWGMKFINALKYRVSRLFDRGKAHKQTLGAFNFLLDFIPDWRKVYLPGGFIQHQSFVPKEHAQECFKRIFELCHEHQIPPFLAVFKRHKADGFLLSHGLDGFSLALDFPIASYSRGRILELTGMIDELVCSVGGRFYPAKDATVSAENFRRALPREDLEAFIALKRQVDPENVLQSDLYRRLFEDAPPNPGLS